MRDFETEQEAATGLRKVRRLGGSVAYGIPPGTLAEVLADVRDGDLHEFAMSRFLLEIYKDTDAKTRRLRIEDEPDLAPNPVLNALLGAAGEYFAQRWDLGEAPAWTLRPERYLNRPFFELVGIPESDLLQQSPPASPRCRRRGTLRAEYLGHLEQETFRPGGTTRTQRKAV